MEPTRPDPQPVRIVVSRNAIGWIIAVALLVTTALVLLWWAWTSPGSSSDSRDTERFIECVRLAPDPSTC